MKIADRAHVTLSYSLKLDDGTLVENSDADDPLTFVFGINQIIPGLERELEGLKVGDEKTVVVEAVDGYGVRDPKAVQRLPREHFPPEVTLEKGVTMSADTPHGEAVFTVTDVTDDDVELDFNHPLADQRLTFEVKILEVRKLTKDEAEFIEHRQAHGCHGSCCECECDDDECDDECGDDECCCEEDAN